MSPYSWEVPQYDCPHCGAKDSTECALLVPADDKYGYPKKYIDQARELGCRIMYYHDLYEQTKQQESST